MKILSLRMQHSLPNKISIYLYNYLSNKASSLEQDRAFSCVTLSLHTDLAKCQGFDLNALSFLRRVAWFDSFMHPLLAMLWAFTS